MSNFSYTFCLGVRGYPKLSASQAINEIDALTSYYYDAFYYLMIPTEKCIKPLEV
jgi:hypothetical protein